MLQFAVLNADKSKVPDVSVTNPVKVVLEVLLLSVNVPFIVVVPFIDTDPLVFKAIELEIDIERLLGIVKLPVPPIITPPIPSIVNVFEPTKEMFSANQFIVLVALIVLFPVDLIVTLGTLNVPAV
jgi:hypothetical protein